MDTEEILQLARAKETEMARIESITDEIAPLKKSWSEWRDGLDQGLRLEVETEMTRLEETLRRLIDLESRGQEEAAKARAETAEKLRRVEGGRRVQRAYKPSSVPPRYLDKSQ